MPRSATAISTPAKKARIGPKRSTPATRKSQAAAGLVKCTPGRAFPLRYQATLRYSRIISITMAGGDGDYGFSTNGCFNPDVTITGIRPLYYEQLMELYTHYSVTNSKLTLQPLTTSAAYVMVTSIDDDNVGGTAQREIQQGASARTVITPGGPMVKTSLTWNRARRYGVGASEGASLTGTVATNPVEQNFFRVQIQEPSAILTEVLVQAVWEADVIFTELKTVTAD